MVRCVDCAGLDLLACDLDFLILVCFVVWCCAKDSGFELGLLVWCGCGWFCFGFSGLCIWILRLIVFLGLLFGGFGFWRGCLRLLWWWWIAYGCFEFWLDLRRHGLVVYLEFADCGSGSGLVCWFLDLCLLVLLLVRSGVWWLWLCDFAAVCL